MRKILLLLLLLPNAAADTADIPPLEVEYSSRFLAAWVTLDGVSQAAAATLFSSMFGDSSPRLTESDETAQAPFHYNLTDFRVGAAAANCGDLAVGETLQVVLRRNGLNTVVGGNCTGGSAQGAFTIDKDILAINPGDRLTIQYTISGALTVRNPRVGVTALGYTNQNTTTEEVLDMTNELLEVVNLVFPILLFAAIVIWAELTKETWLYALAVVAGGIATIAVWADLETVRILLAAASLLLIVRAYVNLTAESEEE